MKLDPNRFEMEVLPGDSIPGAVGLYYLGEQPRIVLASEQLADPERAREHAVELRRALCPEPIDLSGKTVMPALVDALLAGEPVLRRRRDH